MSCKFMRLLMIVAAVNVLGAFSWLDAQQQGNANKTTNTQKNTITTTHTEDGKTPGKVLLAFALDRGWQDAGKSAAKLSWQALPPDGPRPAGVRIDFPAIKAGEWINMTLPVTEGSWPLRGQKLVFWARAAEAGDARIRLNEMPGAAQGKHERHNEFEGHAAAFAVGPQWRQVTVALTDFRVLWRHAGSNGQVDLEHLTGIGFEPADPAKPMQLELAGLQVLDGEPAAQFTRAALERFRIVFNSDRDGDYEILAMDGDGRNLDRLTRHPGYDLWPAPSPDGRRIAWMSNRDGDYEIYVMDADGANLVNLSKHPKSQEGHPTWSPDGKIIAFTSDRDGDMELYLMDADGQNWRRLTQAKGSDGLPSFAPDGKHIVFVSERDGNHELYRIDSDGAGLKRLTDHKALDTMPAWSPDGKTIAFVSDRDGDQAIFLMDADGSNVRRLSGMKAFEGWPDWSPDGKWLCYHALRQDHFSICAVEVATGRVEQLTRGRGSNRNPRFARRAEEAPAPPSIPPGGLRIVAHVSGHLGSGPASPNPQKYPFQYKGYSVLDKAQRAALEKPGAIPADVAGKIGQSLLWPSVGDELTAIKLKSDGKTISGEAKVLHKYGKQGTHVIDVKLDGTLDKGRLSLKASDPKIGGTWDWGGGIAKQVGEVVVKLEVQTTSDVPHPAGDKTTLPEKPKPRMDPPIRKEEPKTIDPPAKAKEAPDKPGTLKITAKVDGHTQATMFNPQKYPFKYTGAAKLGADALKSLAKAGDVPEALAKTLLGCVLWPGMDDKLEKAKLKSDGKKLSGDVQVLHNYGKQGTHTLKFRLEGTLDNGKLTLRAVEPTVSGTWNYGGGSIQLKGDVKIAIEVGS